MHEIAHEIPSNTWGYWGHTCMWDMLLDKRHKHKHMDWI